MGLQECQNEVTMFHSVHTVRQPIGRHQERPTLDYWLIVSRCRIVTLVLVQLSSLC